MIWIKKIFIKSTNLEEIKTDISAFKSGMNNCIGLSDFTEVKEIKENNRANI